MKRTYMLAIATSAVVAAFAIAACSKQADSSSEEKLPGSVRNDVSNPPSGITGISGCYRTYANTLKNPPADYVPGDAQIQLAECMRSFIHLGQPDRT